MKNIKKTLLYFIFLIMLASCFFEDKQELINLGQFNVLQNNETWGSHYHGSQKTIIGKYSPKTSSCSAFYSISFDLFDKDQVLIEAFSFIITDLSTEVTGFKTLTISDFVTNNWCESSQHVFSAFYTTHDDAIIDYYRVLETEVNHLVIESINQEKLEMKGTFNVTFVIDHRSVGSTLLPDTVRFTKGTFQTRILEN